MEPDLLWRYNKLGSESAVMDSGMKKFGLMKTPLYEIFIGMVLICPVIMNLGCRMIRTIRDPHLSVQCPVKYS